MVSKNLDQKIGLVVNENMSKTLEAVDRGVVECHGSAVVQVTYQGQRTQTRLLITPKLKNKVTLSKTVLQNLAMISEDFRNVLVKERAVKMADSLMGRSLNPGDSSAGRLYVPDDSKGGKDYVPVDSLAQGPIKMDNSQTVRSLNPDDSAARRLYVPAEAMVLIHLSFCCVVFLFCALIFPLNIEKF